MVSHNNGHDGAISQRLRIADKRISASHIEDGVEIKIANTRDELRKAYNLIYEQYIGYGYVDSNPLKMRVNLWNTLPHTYTIVAKRDGNIIGTATLICDSDAKLPSDEIASVQLDSLRENGRKLVEVSGLAVDATNSDSSTIMQLFRFAFKLVGQTLGYTDFIITVNPKHEFFYVKRLQFKRLTGTCAYKKVKNAPGIAMCLDLASAHDSYLAKAEDNKSGAKIYDFFFVDEHEPLMAAVRAGLDERREFLTHEFLIDFFRDETGVLEDRLSYKTFDRQWNSFFGSSRRSSRVFRPAGKRASSFFGWWEQGLKVL